MSVAASSLSGFLGVVAGAIISPLIIRRGDRLTTRRIRLEELLSLLHKAEELTDLDPAERGDFSLDIHRIKVIVKLYAPSALRYADEFYAGYEQEISGVSDYENPINYPLVLFRFTNEVSHIFIWEFGAAGEWGICIIWRKLKAFFAGKPKPAQEKLSD